MCIRDRSNSDEVVGEVVLTSDDNDINCNSEVSRNDNIIKNVVSDRDTLKLVSEIVSESERVIGCNRVVFVLVN